MFSDWVEGGYRDEHVLFAVAGNDKGTNCTIAEVCGQKVGTAGLQDFLAYNLKGHADRHNRQAPPFNFVNIQSNGVAISPSEF